MTTEIKVKTETAMTEDEYRARIVELNEQDLGQAYNPLKTVVTIKDDQFRVKQVGVEEPLARFDTMDCQIVGAKMTRILFLEREQKIPTCSSSDYVHGNLNPEFMGVVPEGVGKLCMSCPYNAWGSDKDESGNARKGKRCKERRNLLVLHQDFTRPLVLSLSPSSIGRWDGYADGLASKQPPGNYIEYLTRVTIEVKKDGANEYGVAKFQARQVLPREQVFAVLPLRKQYADWLGRVQVEVKDVLGEDEREEREEYLREEGLET